MSNLVKTLHGAYGYRKTLSLYSDTVNDNECFTTISPQDEEFYNGKEEIGGDDDPAIYALQQAINASCHACSLYNNCDFGVNIAKITIDADFGTEENYNRLMNTQNDDTNLK